uniref:Uncharacterized protein n=1 Tax=viral metagenome TaxID=1070528 RepID=A0A6C0LMH5_9ZZZZ
MTIGNNYESIKKHIRTDSPIINIFIDILKGIPSKDLNFVPKTSSKGYEYIKIHKECKLYQSFHWFYRKDYKSDNNIFYDKVSATRLSLIKCGGLHAYRTIDDVRLLFFNKNLVNSIIKNYLDPLIRSSKYSKYYYYIKLFLRNSISIANDYEKREIKQIKVSKKECIDDFLEMISKIFKFNGIIFYKDNAIKIILNNSNLVKRDLNNRYDWTNWGLDNYIADIKEFDLNPLYFGKNDEFKAYDFYINSLQPSIKIDEDYDFGCLNINQLNSINKLHTKDDCMKALLRFMKRHNISIFCLQDLLYKDAKTFNKFIENEDLYSSLGDFERLNLKDTDLCNVIISSSNIMIINNELLNGDHVITFSHPNYKKKKFINIKTKNINTLQELSKRNIDMIIGNININKEELKPLDYALNSEQVYGTNINETTDMYIMSRLPLVLSSVIPINYKYSDHKVLIGKE